MKSDEKFKINPEEITWACPDPSWEYSEIWHQIQAAKKQLEEILGKLEKTDKPTLESDRQVKKLICTTQSRLEYTVDILSE